MSDNYVISDFGHGYGGLGNQLSRLAAVLEYKNKHNKKAIFINLNKNEHERYIITNEGYNIFFNNKLNTITKNEFDNLKFNMYYENNDKNYELPYIHGNVYLNGYFINFKYISDNTRDEINSLIYNNNIFHSNALNYYNNIKLHFKDDNDDNYIFIHIRLGDLVIEHNFKNIDMNFYKNSLNELYKDNKNNKHIIIFSEDIEWCKNNINFDNDSIYYIDNLNNHYTEFILMSLIQNGIIGYSYCSSYTHISSFSLWAGYIGHKNKNIIIQDAHKDFLKK